MKKIWLMLLMISSVCFFTACSDDENDKGGNSGKNPITDLYLSDEIETGASTTVLGKGFAADAQIFVENASGERTKIENVVVDSKGITFTLPATLTTGEYSLVLKQDGGEWKLGTFKVLKMVEVTQVKKVTGELTGLMPELAYDLTYDEYGRLKSISNTYEYEDEDGTMVSQTVGYDLTYTGNSIQVGGSIVDNESVFPITYTLEDGKIVQSESKNSGFQVGEVYDANYTWNYNGDYLKSLTDATTTIDYKYEEGNLMSIGETASFVYGTKVNNVNVDIVYWSLFFLGELTPDQFLPSIWGACGKLSKNLPSKVNLASMGAVNAPCSYTFNNEGNVSSVSIVIMEATEDMEAMIEIIDFEYETVKVIVE